MLVVVLVLRVVLMIGTRGREPGGALVGLAIGVLVAGPISLVRAVVLPRLVIDLAQGVLRTRTGAEPVTAIAAVRVTREKAGTWARFIGDDGRTLARMSLGETLFAAPTGDQWAALGQVIHSAALARSAPPWMPSPAPSNGVAPAHAVDVFRAQAAWCAAGRRSGDRRAPVTALVPSTIDVGHRSSTFVR